MADTRRIGMLTPSSNTVLEPYTGALLAGVAGVSVHYARFAVTEISLSEQALAQFDVAPIEAAARLLGDALVHAISWNGTSAGWLGFERDRELIEVIGAAAGAPAGTAVLAIDALLRRAGMRRIGFVTPYATEVQERIVANWEAAGYACVAERHLGITRNHAFADIGDEAVASMIREVAKAGPEAIVVLCTNFRGTLVAPALERELGVAICDSIAAAAWQGLELAGVPGDALARFGRLYAAAG